MTARPTFANRGDPGDGAAILLDFGASDGRAQAIEVIGRPGMASVDAADEGNHYVYVVAGTWAIAVDGDERERTPDTSVFAPVRCRLRYSMTGDAPGTLLLITMPG